MGSLELQKLVANAMIQNERSQGQGQSWKLSLNGPPHRTAAADRIQVETRPVLGSQHTEDNPQLTHTLPLPFCSLAEAQTSLVPTNVSSQITCQ